MKPPVVLLIAVAVFLSLAGCGLVEEPPPQFQIRLTGPRAEGDAIKVARKDGEIVFFVTSEFGIGRATIQPLKEDWPDRIVFQLDLNGLESFEVEGEQIYRTERHDDRQKGGYRVDVPVGVSGSGREPIDVSWIDYYRN